MPDEPAVSSSERDLRGLRKEKEKARLIPKEFVKQVVETPEDNDDFDNG